MVALQANLIMANLSIGTGVTVRWGQPGEEPDGAGIAPDAVAVESKVTLSRASRRVSESVRMPDRSLTYTGDFDALVKGMHEQLVEKGAKAAFLHQAPDGADPARLELAQQAANYLSQSLYAGHKLFANASSDNPYAAIDRRSLSAIAFEDRGVFTAAERHVAFLELTWRDMQYRNLTYAGKSPDESGDQVGRHMVASYLRDAELSSVMGDAERAWRGWDSERKLRAKAAKLLKRLNLEEPRLAKYGQRPGNQKGLLAIVKEGTGRRSWGNIGFREAADPNVILLQLVVGVADRKTRNTAAARVATYSAISRLR